MAFSVSPSVIVREVDASAAVPAIATPPAAIAGVFRWGPVNETVLVSSENELVDRFGTPDDDNYETFFTAADYLSYSSALWVTRVDDGSVAAEGVTDLIYFDANTETVTANSTNGFVAGETPGTTGTIDRANTEIGAFEGLYAGSLGNEIDVVYVNSESFITDVVSVGQAKDGQTYVAVANNIPAGTFSDSMAYGDDDVTLLMTNVERIGGDYAIWPEGGFSIVAGDTIRVGNDSVGYQDMQIQSWSEMALDQYGLEVEAPSDPANNATVRDTISYYQYTVKFVENYALFESAISKLSFEKRSSLAGVFGKAPSTGNYHIAVIDRNGEITGAPGEFIETYINVSTNTAAKLPDGRTNYYKDAIAQNSAWVKVANTAYFEAATSQTEVLMFGADGSTESTVSLQALAEGYDYYANPNEIDVSFVLQGKGDRLATRANYIISNVVDSRKDAIAFLSPSKEDVVDESKSNAMLSNVISYRNRLQNSSYWFMDSGYKYRYDKYNDVYRFVPLNGDMAGLASRVEPFESPAGFRKGVIKNVVKLAFNPNKAQRDQLYSSDINPVMSQVGQGIVLFGDKTGLGTQSAFDRLNVRRLFIAVEKAIANAAQGFLFELNDEFTQTQFKNIVEPFLRDIQGRRGIIDFRVISDSTVNTPVVIDQGKFRANIFIKPARSINVIELTFVATRTGVEFDEIVGSIS